MTNPSHLSHTQIKMALRCGQQYYYRYCKGLILPPGVALVQGTVAHKVRQADLQHKLSAGEDLPVEAVETVAAEEIDRAFAGDIILDGDWAAHGPKRARGIAKDQSVALARLDRSEFLPEIVPLEVEEVRTVRHPLLPRPIKFVIDLVTAGHQIRDLKTTGRSPAKDDADKDLQLTLYALGRRLATGETESSVRKDYLVKTKTPKAVFQTSTRSINDLQVVLNRIARVAEAIEKELWLPAPIDAWWCSPRWCGYWEQCPYAAGRSRPTT